MSRLRMTLFGSAFVLSSLFLAGCSSASGTSTDGATLVDQACTRCHPIDRVAAAKKDRAGWTRTVDRMRTHGVQLTDAQAMAIVDYLTKRDGGQ